MIMQNFAKEAEAYCENKGILFTKSDIKNAYTDAAKSVVHCAELALCTACQRANKHASHDCLEKDGKKCEMYNIFVEQLNK